MHALALRTRSRSSLGPGTGSATVANTNGWPSSLKLQLASLRPVVVR